VRVELGSFLIVVAPWSFSNQAVSLKEIADRTGGWPMLKGLMLH
jgi:hypothetical protein